MERINPNSIGGKITLWLWAILLMAVAGALGFGLIKLALFAINYLPTNDGAARDTPGQLAPLTSPSTHLGTAPTYNEAGEPIIVANINPLLTQAEQGIDDRSGYTYPCVTAVGNGNVCQRQLSEAEATAEGH